MAGQARQTAELPPTPPLVGRERELATLRAALAAALNGHGSLALIGGEAGIGKTALAEALLAEATARGARVMVGRCYDLSETPPYGPWREAFARAPADTSLPTLPTAMQPSEGPGGSLGSREAIIARVLAYLAALAAQRPLVLLLDDLHWSDPTSLDLLRVVARGLTELPLLLLATYRADEIAHGQHLDTLLPLLAREGRAARLDLRPLDRAAIDTLVATRYALPLADRARLVAYLAGRTEGNALFLGELFRTLEGEGVLHRENGRWHLGDLSGVPIPALLRQVIAGRLHRLPPETARLLAIAAVIGQDVPLALWATVAETGEVALADHAERATAARLLVEVPDGSGVRFAHALIREALYAGFSAIRRRGWHRRIGELLAQQPRPDPDIVAYHFRTARDTRAVGWLVQSGERAQRAFAWLTAAERFMAANELAEAVDMDRRERGWLLYHLATLQALSNSEDIVTSLDQAEQLAHDVGDRALAALAIFWRGTLRCITGDRRGGLPDMETGVMRRLTLTSAERATIPTLPIPHTLRDDTDGQGLLVQWLATVGRYTQAREIGERALIEAAQQRDAPFIGDILLGLAQVYAGLGQAQKARATFAQAHRAFHAIGHHFMAGITASNELRWVFPYIADDPATVSRLLNEMSAAMDGPTESPSEYLRRYPRMIRQLIGGAWQQGREQADVPGAPFGFQQTAWQLLAPILRAQGDADAAREIVRTVLPDGPLTTPGNAWIPCGLMALQLGAALALDAGDTVAMREWLAAHDTWVTWSASPLGRAEGALGWVSYHRATGNVTEARVVARLALEYASAPRQPLILLAARRILGELATGAGHHTEAASQLAAALALADACATPYERALTLLALAELHAASGEPAAASAALAEARALLIPLGALPALARAEALEGRLAAPIPSATPATLPFRLTAREAEVLRLVAQGLTNAQAADRLFVTPRTINAHLTNIYTKLGVEGRAAAIRLALHHDLG